MEPAINCMLIDQSTAYTTPPRCAYGVLFSVVLINIANLVMARGVICPTCHGDDDGRGI